MSININPSLPSTPQVNNESLPGDSSTKLGALSGQSTDGHVAGTAIVSDNAFSVVGQKFSLGTTSGSKQSSEIPTTISQTAQAASLKASQQVAGGLNSSLTPTNLQKSFGVPSNLVNQTNNSSTDRQQFSATPSRQTLSGSPSKPLSNNIKTNISSENIRNTLSSKPLGIQTSQTTFEKQSVQIGNRPELNSSRPPSKPMQTAGNITDLKTNNTPAFVKSSGNLSVIRGKEDVTTVSSSAENVVSSKPIQLKSTLVESGIREFQKDLRFANKASVGESKEITKNDSELKNLAAAQSGSKAAAEKATKEEKTENITINPQISDKEQKQQQGNNKQDEQQKEQDKSNNPKISESKSIPNNKVLSATNLPIVSMLTQSEIDNIKKIAEKTHSVLDKWLKSLASSNEVSQSVEELNNVLVQAGFESILSQAKVISSDTVEKVKVLAEKLISSNNISKEAIKIEVNQLAVDAKNRIIPLLGFTSDGPVINRVQVRNAIKRTDPGGKPIERKTDDPDYRPGMNEYVTEEILISQNVTSVMDAGVYERDAAGNVVEREVEINGYKVKSFLSKLHFGDNFAVPDVNLVNFDNDEQAVEYALHLAFYSTMLNALNSESEQTASLFKDILEALFQALSNSFSLLKHS